MKYKYTREELKQKLAIFFLECNLSKSQDSEAVEFLDLIVATKGINKNNTPSRQPEMGFDDYSPNPCLTKEQKIERVIKIALDGMVRKISYINKFTKTK